MERPRIGEYQGCSSRETGGLSAVQYHCGQLVTILATYASQEEGKGSWVLTTSLTHADTEDARAQKMVSCVGSQSCRGIEP